MESEKHFIELELTSVLSEQNHLLHLAQFFAKEPGTSFLYSGGDFPLSQRSFLAIFPYAYIHIQAEEQCKGLIGSKAKLLLQENPWDALKLFLAGVHSECTLPTWIGYLGYEMGAFSEPSFQLKHAKSDLPLAFFQRFAVLLTFDHTTARSFMRIELEALVHLNEMQHKQVKCLKTLSGWKEALAKANCQNAPSQSQKLTVSQPLDATVFQSQVNSIKELINEGTIYQVNLSQKLSLKGRRDAFDIFKELTACNPAPYACYLDLPSGQIISSSPEQFLLKKGKHLFTEPIKGTAPRGHTLEEDLIWQESLLSSPKENAELLMITDLMRNDLGKISLPGSVKCEAKWKCQAYQNVFHLSSPVQSMIHSHWHFLEALRACFPGGSITGCPKFKAMEVIHALEQKPRGVYTGSIGYFTASEDFNFNIAIRTLTISEDKIEVALGAGIVADSDPEKEFDELLHKGRSIFKVLGLSKEAIFSAPK
jgi:para-aminobenzoate synthetase component 1